MNKEQGPTTLQDDPEGLTKVEKKEILRTAEEGSASIQETLANVNTLVSERLKEKRVVVDKERIQEIQKELEQKEPSRDHIAEQAESEREFSKAMEIEDELKSLLKMETRSWKHIFKKPRYVETGEMVDTKEGQQFEIVTDKNGEKFVCIELHHKGENENSYQKRVVKHYIQFEKATPFLK